MAQKFARAVGGRHGSFFVPMLIAGVAIVAVIANAKGVLGRAWIVETPAARFECGPVDSAWSAGLHLVDSATGRGVADATIASGMDFAVTDSAGNACFRSLADSSHTFAISRRGYRDTSAVVRGTAGEARTLDVSLVRVERPCCDLRGPWRITMQLDSPGLMHPKPVDRRVAGAVLLGPRHAAPQDGDALDSLVRVERGLHAVDFKPFFGGPVARDLSTSIFGSGPDLFHEVEASVINGDSVSITFIPRMSHGSISMMGRIQSDAIRGDWVQNAYCCGATGTFTMTRTGPVDTAHLALAAPPEDRRRARHRPAPDLVPAGEMPYSTWRPYVALDDSDRLWLASGGLFVADSFGGTWRRVLGGQTDPVGKDELRIGIHLAFVDRETVVVGLPERFQNSKAPVLYRTTDGGRSWRATLLDGVQTVDALAAIGRSVWMVSTVHEVAHPTLFRSEDGGAKWDRIALPEPIEDAHDLVRISVRAAYLASSGRGGAKALWRTDDRGATWQPLPTPHDQRLHDVADYKSRIEALAIVGRWLVVREQGTVFVSPVDTIRWRALPGVDRIAGDRDGTQLFTLRTSGHAALLDKDLRPVWTTTAAVRIPESDYIDQVELRRGTGYIITGHSLFVSVRDGQIRTLRPR